MILGGTLETSTFEVKSLLRLRQSLTSTLKFFKFKSVRPAELGLTVFNPNYFGAHAKITRIKHLAEV